MLEHRNKSAYLIEHGFPHCVGCGHVSVEPQEPGHVGVYCRWWLHAIYEATDDVIEEQYEIMMNHDQRNNCPAGRIRIKAENQIYGGDAA